MTLLKQDLVRVEMDINEEVDRNTTLSRLYNVVCLSVYHLPTILLCINAGKYIIDLKTY